MSEDKRTLNIPVPSASNKFAPFEISTVAYKVIDGHQILADILVPKTLIASGSHPAGWKQKRPVVARFHGGWLIVGRRDDEMWIAKWSLDLASNYDAIFVSADYRLLPEAAGAEDILDDVDDFWRWVGAPDGLGEVVKQIYSGLEIDLDRVLVTGESAGGYLSIQSGLSLSSSETSTSSSGLHLRAVVAAFPMLNLRSPHYTQDSDKRDIFGYPQLPNSLVNEQIATLRGAAGPDGIVTNTPVTGVTQRETFAVAVAQHGRFAELLGVGRDSTPRKRRIHPEDRVSDGASLPPTFIIHGFEDSIVPIVGTETFVKLVEEHGTLEKSGKGMSFREAFRFIKEPNGFHGVGADFSLGSTGWLKEMESFVEKYWLS